MTSFHYEKIAADRITEFFISPSQNEHAFYSVFRAVFEQQQTVLPVYMNRCARRGRRGMDG